jgi:hypothetical protein
MWVTKIVTHTPWAIFCHTSNTCPALSQWMANTLPSGLGWLNGAISAMMRPVSAGLVWVM